MTSKNKYWVMEKEGRKKFLSLIMSQLNLRKLNDEDNYLPYDEFGEKIFNMLKKGIPSLKIMGHIYYELGKDLKNMDFQNIIDYLTTNNINMDKFSENYHNNGTASINGLLLFALFDHANIDMSADPALSGNLLCDSLINPTDLSLISKENKEILDQFHTRYMEENIYPKVKAQTTKEDILKILKNIK